MTDGTSSDERYDLISVLSHATHGADDRDRFIANAARRGDEGLAWFLREIRDDDQARAQRAK